MNVSIHNKPFEKLKSGIDKLADPVRQTLGPNGKNILFSGDVTGSGPLSTRDGVTVSHFIHLKDKVENIGAALVKHAARNTNNEAGDGTTTATVLAQAIFSEGLKYLASGLSPIGIKRSIDEASEKVLSNLKEITQEVKDVEHVATISANNDSNIGRLIAEAVNRVGKDGSILVEESNKTETHVSFQDGMIIERGWSETSPYFINNLQKRSIEYDQPEIVIIDDRIHRFEQLEPVMKYVAKSKKPLIIIVKDIEDSVLAWIIANKVKGGVPVGVIKTPGFNDSELVGDIACRVGARHYSPDWNPISNFKPEDLGHAQKIIVRKSDTTIIQGCGDICDRHVELNEQVKNEEDEITRGRIQDRINRLTSSVATINVAANSETEMKDLKLRIEDAINATRHALAEGVVQGGGTALLRIRPKGESIGEKILFKALEMPFRYIITNADENAEKILSDIELKGGTFGYDAHNKEITDMFEKGIIDPVKVTRTAFSKAVSVATMLLLTGSCIVGEDKDEK